MHAMVSLKASLQQHRCVDLADDVYPLEPGPVVRIGPNQVGEQRLPSRTVILRRRLAATF